MMKNEDNGLNRRDFLKFGLAAGAVATTTVALPKFSLANVSTVKLDECMAMSADQMAQKSRLVTDSMAYLKDATGSIRNPAIRETVQGILRDPAPTLMADLMDDNNRKAVFDELKAKGLLSEETTFETFLPPTQNPYKAPHPFISGPGSGYGSHHSYPGGVASHTAANVMISLSIYDHYKNVYGYALDRDVVIASQALHDLHKAWVFQWGEDGESRTEMKIAGTGEHHTLSVAESIKRSLAPEVIVAQACAHDHPGFSDNEAKSVNWIKTAAILTGTDPIKAGLLSKDGQTLPQPRRMENFICHLGDHDWVLTVPAAKWTIPVMKEIAAEKYNMSDADLNGKAFKHLRNYVFSQASIMSLYEIYSTRGKDALAYTAMSIVAPA